jgi:hypothetical protein
MAQKSTMRPPTVVPAVLLATGVAFAPVSQADTLLVDAVAAASDSAGERPARGMTMTTVERRWGEPISRSAAVGQPPITRWEYPDFVVFFEYRHVIHAVARAR